MQSILLSPEQANQLRRWFESRPWFEPIERPYAAFAYRVKGETLGWAYYPKKGVLVREGKPGAMGEAAAAELAETFAFLSSTPTVQPHSYPYIGADESGKGDTFGPLVVAACAVDRREETLLATLGVRDSKSLSDAQASRLAVQIRQVLGFRACLRVLVPEVYNRAIEEVQASGGNLNTLLSRLHGACVHELMALVRPAWIVIDRFGPAEAIKAELPADIPVTIQPRAECYVAVAAASILARDACLGWFAREKAAGRIWPRGSSDPRIPELLKHTAEVEGTPALTRYAKLHFEPVQRVLRAMGG